MKLAQDSNKSNNLNLLRFIAASTVLYQHSYPLSGLPQISYFADLVKAVAVFFIISGFLITKSWCKSKSFHYVQHRFLRIVPGLFVCLLFTVCILGPICTKLATSEYFSNKETHGYLVKNILFNVQYYLPGVFENNPYKAAVNGSLWTLPIEVFCYIGVALFGLIKLLQKRHFVVLITILIIIDFYYVTTKPDALLVQNLPSFLTKINSLRCVIYFLIGAIFFLYSDKISLKKLPILLTGLIYLWLPNNDYVGFLCLPYLVFYLAFGFKFKNDFLKDFGKKYDLSYGIYIYAFPIQQTIMHFFASQITLPVFFIFSYLITLILAFFSFVIVEKPCLNLKI